eukprot:jgi/Mesen1/3647/ME000200S02723
MADYEIPEVLHFWASVGAAGASAWFALIGGIGLAAGWHVFGLPNFFFGLIVLGIVLFAFTAPYGWRHLPGQRKELHLGQALGGEERAGERLGKVEGGTGVGPRCKTMAVESLRGTPLAAMPLPWEVHMPQSLKVEDNEELGVVPTRGLASEEAAARLKEYGPNVTIMAAMPRFLAFFAKEIYEPTQVGVRPVVFATAALPLLLLLLLVVVVVVMVAALRKRNAQTLLSAPLLLVAVAVLYALFGDWGEFVTALAIILLMVLAEVATEWRSKRALLELSSSAPRDALAVREGEAVRVDRTLLVPGDVVLLRPGMEVPADVRILQGHFLELDESSMSGESAPVPKDPRCQLAARLEPAECANLALAGSVVTRGKATGVVYRTGASTAAAATLAGVRRRKEKKTPLQVMLSQLAARLCYVAIGASVVGALLGIVKGQSGSRIVLTALSLAFATIPEELPILIAAVLAVGARTLASRRVYVKHLRSAESLGLVDTVLTDKTGTLTGGSRLGLHSVQMAGSAVMGDDVALAATRVPTRGHLAQPGSFKGLLRVLEAWLYMSDIGEEEQEQQEHEREQGESIASMHVHVDVDGDVRTRTVTAGGGGSGGGGGGGGDSSAREMQLEAPGLLAQEEEDEEERAGRGRRSRGLFVPPPGSSARSDVTIDVDQDAVLLPTSGRGAAAATKGVWAAPGVRVGDPFDQAILSVLGGMAVLSCSSSEGGEGQLGATAMERPPRSGDVAGASTSTSASGAGGTESGRDGEEEGTEGARGAVRGMYRRKLGAQLLAEAPFESRSKFAVRAFRRGAGTAGQFQQQQQQRTEEYGADSHRAAIPQRLGPASKRRLLQAGVAGPHSGLRMVGYAAKELSEAEAGELTPGGGCNEDPDAPSGLLDLKDAAFLGAVAFEDPIREGAADAVLACTNAGIRVIMVTGDHVSTATAVATRVGILSPQDVAEGVLSCAECPPHRMADEEISEVLSSALVFARATPGDKLRILDSLQAAGHCVAVTGDGKWRSFVAAGMNDAAVLAAADVGMAMGVGTDVARDAAAMVLLDSDFSNLAFAVSEGRRLLDNLRKAVAFYLGAKAGLVILFVVGTLWDRRDLNFCRFPLAPIHIILLELYMDLGATLSFVMEPGDSDLMQRPPRRAAEPFFDAELVTGVAVCAGSMALCTLLSFGFGLWYHDEGAQTHAFLAWLVAHVMLAFNMRTWREPVSDKGLSTNPAMLVWIAASFGLALLLALWGGLRTRLQLQPIAPWMWVLIVGISIVGTWWLEIGKIGFLVAEERGWISDSVLWQRLEKNETDIADHGDPDGMMRETLAPPESHLPRERGIP